MDVKGVMAVQDGVSAMTKGMGQSSTAFTHAMEPRVDEFLSDTELVCALSGMSIDEFDNPVNLYKNDIISRYFKRVFIIASDSEGTSASDAQNNTLSFFRTLKNKIADEGQAMGLCLHDYPNFMKLVRFIAWFFKVFGMFIFIYILTYVIISPLAFAYTKKASEGYPTKNCTAIGITKWITLTLVLVFIIVYVLTGLPNVVENSIEMSVDNMPNIPRTILNSTVVPITNAIANAVTYLQYKLYDIITFGYFAIYQMGVQIGVKFLYYGLAEADQFSCDDKDQIIRLGERLRKFINSPMGQSQLSNYKMLDAVNNFADSLSPERMETLRQTSYIRYIIAKITKSVFCQGLKTASWLYDMLKDIGSPSMVEDMILDGNMAGFSYSIAFVVILLFVIFASSMFGITFK